MKNKLSILSVILLSLILSGCKPHEHNLTSWRGDDMHHWHECTNCDDILDKENHSYGEWSIIKDSTTTEEGSKERLCSVCSYKDVEIIELKNHDHTGNGEWQKNENQHWKDCLGCDEDVDKANHTYGEGVETTIATDVEGEMSYTCSVCNYVYKEAVEKYYKVGELVDKSWQNYEDFTVYARRSLNSISLRILSDNTVFTSQGRDSSLEIYFVSGNNMVFRDGNDGVTRLSIYSNKQMFVYNYANKIINQALIKHSVKVNSKTIIDVEVPYSVIGVNNNDIFGLNVGLWSNVDNDWAPLKIINTDKEINVEKLSTYLRCDKNNLYFESVNNDYPENISAPNYVKENLIKDYPFGIANPEHVLDLSADDIYLKTTKLSDGFQFDMRGFGSLTSNEYIKLVIHTSNTDGTNWNIQESDVSFLIASDYAAKKTGMTNFWDYKNFSADETVANNTPLLVEYIAGYFDLSFVVDFEEIPNYDSEKEITFIALEFNYGNIYNNEKVVENAMTRNGVGVGDPALQSSYQVLQKDKETIDRENVLANYNLQFSESYFANIVKESDGIRVNIISYEELENTDFVRFIIDTDGNSTSGLWEIDIKDVSFTIYKDKAYTVTGNTNFWDLENNNNGQYKFHNGEETNITPEFSETGNYWTLSLKINYSELGTNITNASNLKGSLSFFKDNMILNYGFVNNGEVIEDIAFQNSYFSIN